MQESEFLAALENEPIDMGPLLEAIRAEYGVKKSRSESWADQLAEKMLGKKQYQEVCLAVETFADCTENSREIAGAKMTRLLKDDPDLSVLVPHAGFDNKRLLLGKCMGRMSMLLRMAPDAMVFDRKSWGFGLIRAVRYHEEKVEIDFTKKPGHQLAFSYAAEILHLLDEGHLLALKHNDPAGLEELIKKDPGEVVMIALRSFGPMPVPILQDRIVPEIIEQAQWKKFWEGARRKLKNSNLVEFPTKRSEPILLLSKEKTYDDEWFARLAKNTDMESILVEMIDLRDKGDSSTLTDSQRDIIKDRVGFTVNGAEGNRNNLLVRAMLIGLEFGLTHTDVRAGRFIDRIFDRRYFLDTLPELLAKETKGLFAFLIDLDRDRALELVLDVINELDISTLGEGVDRMVEHGYEERVSAALRKKWSTWDTSMPVLYWFATHLEQLDTWKIGQIVDLPTRILKQFVDDATGDVLKAQNQLKALFGQKKWLEEVMGIMDERQRGAMTQGIKDSSAWPTLDRNSILGQIVKLYPEMQPIVSGQGESSSTISEMPRVSSIRSMTLLAHQFDKLVREEIPKNSEDIKIAREYGDLRENAEFKAAKEHQSVLMRRQAEMDDMLKGIRPTDFEDVVSEGAGLATGVSLEYDDGQSAKYFILGELDSNQELNIISCSSAMAKALQGKKAGERVTVPSEQGDTLATLTEVTPLPEVIRAWVREEPDA